MANEKANENKAVQAEKKPNPLVRLGKSTVKFFKDLKSELKKIVWPTPKETLNGTIVVAVAVVVVGAFVGLLDALFTFLLQFVIG